MPQLLLIDRLNARRAIPPETYRRLRQWERDLRAISLLVHYAAERGGATTTVRESAEQLSAVLDHDDSSPLAGLLRRPASQLAADGMEVRTITRHLETVHAVAREALDLDGLVREIQTKVADLWSRYRERLPWLTETHLRTAGLDEARLVRLRRPREAHRLSARLASVEAALASDFAELPEGSNKRITIGERGFGPTPCELQLLCARRIREREQLVPAQSIHATIRTLSIDHLAELGTLTGWTADARSPEQLLTEQLLARGSRGYGPDERVESGLWFGALRGADLVRAGDKTERAWQARLPEARTAERADVGESTLFVIPLNDTFAYVSHDVRSAARIKSRGFAVGGSVAVGLGEAANETVDRRIADLDLAPLFDGLSPEPGWYRTANASMLSVIAEAGPRAWFAQIVSRGRLSRLKDPAWRTSPEGQLGVRVVQSGRQVNSAATIGVGPTEHGTSPTNTWLGFDTHEVLTPFSGTPIAWLRTMTSARSERQCLDREWELFTALEEATGSNALRPLTRATMRRGKRQGYLYAPPLAVTHRTEPSVLDEWVNDGFSARNLFLGAIARTIQSVHAAGFALAACHIRAFGYAPDFLSYPTHIVPMAILIHGSFATRFGEPLQCDSAAEPLRELVYDRLGYRGLAIGIESHTIASPVVDAVGFALIALNMFCRASPPGRMYNWFEMLERLDRDAEKLFGSDCAVARSVAAHLAEQTRWHLLQPFLELAATTFPARSPSAT